MPGPRPRVTLHFAQSLDGRIGLAGLRTPLSSSAGFALAHRARAEHDAVLVGRVTVEVDDPQLAAAPVGPQPRRIVLASTLALPPRARVLHGGPGTMVVGVEGRACDADRAKLQAIGAEVRLVSAGSDGRVGLRAALDAIHAWGVRRLLVEGGASVLTSFLREELADEATIEIVPRLLGAPGVPAVGPLGIETIEQALTLQDARVERADESFVVRGRLAYG
jgi:5-amino-6-(5-phosphoribosylamino)uracil reductase/diaminohydroxyphosphoribosylaminopyrimidine deaminase/5-amino-6-(5-phosphoribosylamino)uracil reductase